MRTAAARRERFLPYAYGRGELLLKVSACILDGEASVAPDVQRHLLELDVPWSSAGLKLEVQVPRGVADRVLPEGAKPDEVQLLLKLHCPATFLRSGHTASIAAFDHSSTIEWTISRNQLAASAYLQLFLVRARTVDVAPQFGGTQGVRLADSSTWELRLDRTRETHGEYLDIRYRPFSKEDVIPLRDRKNLYRLEIDQASPVLYINSDHENVARVLESKGTVGRVARLREVVFDQIAHSVWSQLFFHAATSYVDLEEETAYPWQAAVLELLLRDVFPEGGSSSARHDRLTEEWNELPGLMERVDAALQRKHDLAGHLEKLLAEEEQT